MGGVSPKVDDVIPVRPSAMGSEVSASPSVSTTRRITAGRLAAHAAALQEGLRLYQTIFERSALGQLIVDFPTFRIDVVNKVLVSAGPVPVAAAA